MNPLVILAYSVTGLIVSLTWLIIVLKKKSLSDQE